MIVPLQIEIAFISHNRDWLEGSCWVYIFNRSKINTVGIIESFLSGTNVKRSRYAHQASLASLVYLSNVTLKEHFLHDMKYIPSTKAEAFSQLAKGSFIVKKVLEFSQILE